MGDKEAGRLHYKLVSIPNLLGRAVCLVLEIPYFNHTPSQVENIRLELKQLLEIITNKDAEGMKMYLRSVTYC